MFTINLSSKLIGILNDYRPKIVSEQKENHGWYEDNQKKRVSAKQHYLATSRYIVGQSTNLAR